MQSSFSFAQDRRIETRWPAARAGFALWSPMLHLRPELVDFNSHGLAFRVPGSVPLSVGNNVSLLLQTDRAIPVLRLTTRVATVARHGGKLRIGGPIEDAEPVLRHGLWVPASGDLVRVEAADQRQQVLAAIRKRGTPAMLLPHAKSQVAVSVCASPKDDSEDGVYLALPAEVEVSDASQARLQFIIHGACFTIDGVLRRDALGRTFLATPYELRSMSRRQHDRVQLSSDEGTLQWRHPLDPAREVRAPVRDLSTQGVGVVVPASMVPFPPTERAQMTLELRGESIEIEGELAHLSAEGESVRLGLRVAAQTPLDAMRIAHLCRSVRFPKLHSRALAPADAVDDLMRASGYLGLRKDMHPPAEWHHAVSNEGLSVDTVQREPDGTLTGHLSCLRVYSKTWMYHQLATIGQSLQSRECRRALYLDVVTWVALLGGAGGYSIAYFDRSKTWHQLLFERFVDWAGSELLAVTMSLDRFEPEGSLLEALPLPAGLSIGPLHVDEAFEAASLVASSLPGLAIRALDLSEPLIAQHLGCAELYAREGCERDRYPFALRDQEKLMGLAMCEVGSPELSLFNLLNMGQLFVKPGVPADAQIALVRHVQSFYAQRRVTNPIIVSPPGVLGHASRAGLVLAEMMGAIAISAEGLKQYRNFLSFQLGRHARVESVTEPPQRSAPSRSHESLSTRAR